MIRKNWLLFLIVFSVPTHAIGMGILGKIWDRCCKRRGSHVHAAQRLPASELLEVQGCYMNRVAYRFFQPLFSLSSRVITKPSYTFIFAFPEGDVAAIRETVNQTWEQCIQIGVREGGVVWLDGLSKVWVVFSADTYEEMQPAVKSFWKGYTAWLEEHPALRAAIVFVKEEVSFSLKSHRESHLRGLNTFGRWTTEAYRFMNEIEASWGADIFIPKPLCGSIALTTSESFEENFVVCSSADFLALF